MASIKGYIKNSIWSLLSLSFLGMLGVGAFLVYIESQLPDISALENVQLQVPLRIYTHDGKLMGEFGEKRRIPVPFAQIPKPLIQAVLATEDQRFYSHSGIDFYGLIRAAKHLVETGTKGQGGSTITMQVARNFFLSRRKTYLRKLREVLLAIKIDHKLSKDKILELYLNKIFFGHRAYGIAAAAQTYYGKTLDELSLPQVAMLAGLPKAPSALNPLVNPSAAIDRRNHVLSRMFELKYIDNATYQEALHTPLTAQYHTLTIEFEAPYVAEMTRAFLLEHFGEDIYTKGYRVYTTVNSHIQQKAREAIRHGLLAYSKRHGYRGPEQQLTLPADGDISSWLTALDGINTVNGLIPAAVENVYEQSADVLLADGRQIHLPWSGLQWARPYKEGKWTPEPKQAEDILAIGDVVRINDEGNAHWVLSQIPEAEGALVSIDPGDGAIMALVGGFDYYQSKFNRAWQAKRQPGSALKPFIYAAALAKEYTLATLINDAPVVLHDTGDDTLWRPQNDTRRFYGPTRLRIGLIRSRNLVSIRLLQDIGIMYARQYLTNFGFNKDDLPNSLSLALGTASITPLELARGFAVFANGGYLIKPYLVDYILDNNGQVVYQAQPKYVLKPEEMPITTNAESNVQLNRSTAMRTISPEVNYLMTSVLRDVIQSGTGRRAKQLGRKDLAGKTGTTNDKLDAWFAGFNSDIATVVWVGFDQPRSLHEYGSQAALPIWIDFMHTPLKGKPEYTLPRPASIITARIDPTSGLLARPGQSNAIFESFRQDLAPKQQASVNNSHSTEHSEPEPIF